MKPIITDFNPSSYLDNEELIAEYLSQVMADGDTEELLATLGHIAKARGMKNSNPGQESLCKPFRRKRPRLLNDMVTTNPYLNKN